MTHVTIEVRKPLFFSEVPQFWELKTSHKNLIWSKTKLLADENPIWPRYTTKIMQKKSELLPMYLG